MRLLSLLDDGIASRALLAAVLVGILCGVVGVQVVLRRLAFFSMAMTHATFPGVVLASLLGVDLLLGSAGFGALVVVAFTLVRRRDSVDDASVTGVLLAGGLALGTLLLSAQSGFSRDLSHFLVGDPLSVDRADLVELSVLVVLVLGVVVTLRRQLTLAAFDPAALEAQGWPIRTLDVLLLLLVELTVVAGVESVGTILTVSLLVAPAAAARFWCTSVASTTVVAVVLAVLSGVAGVVLTENVRVAGGGATVLTATAFFLLSAAAHGVRQVRA